MHRLGGLADSNGYISSLSSGYALGYSLHPVPLNFEEASSDQAENTGKFSVGFQIDELRLRIMQLFEAKSLVVSLSMATVCAEASMNYYCRKTEFYCGDRALQRRCFLLAVLYNFIRETSCDLRDMAEDAKEGLQTLPVRLGKQNTMLLMTITGLVLDVGLTQSVAFTSTGITVRSLQLAYSILRVGLTMAAYWQILKYPRNNEWAWGSVCLLGLVPVLFAHAALTN
jgi:hypothetical protein